MRILYSHSFTPRLSPKVRAFRAILDEAIDAARQARDSTPGSPFVATVVEGIGVDYADPVNSIFPLIETCVVLISALFDETRSPEEGFVSSASLQEITVAYRAGKKTMVWVEEGCADRLGFTPHLTTYGEIHTDEMLLAEGRQRITQAITDRLLGATGKAPTQRGGADLRLTGSGAGSVSLMMPGLCRHAAAACFQSRHEPPPSPSEAAAHAVPSGALLRGLAGPGPR